ncbi:MAG: hypothetical protein GXP55_05865 [Deltaproteobacteria bacterium]|nr:hypothetical protein [Deltaproteobacteria bacterium]
MSDEPERPNRPTVRGYATPCLTGQDTGEAGRAPAPRCIPPTMPPPGGPSEAAGPCCASSPLDHAPLVEIEVIHQHGPAPRADRPYRTLEVYTQNRIYTMNPWMTCVGVRDRAGDEHPEHAFLGCRLVGGQHREGERIELSYPFPRPGTEAVFERPEGKPGTFARTSTVTRVVLRLHVVTVAPRSVAPTWSEITGSLNLNG